MRKTSWMPGFKTQAPATKAEVHQQESPTTSHLQYHSSMSTYNNVCGSRISLFSHLKMHRKHPPRGLGVIADDGAEGQMFHCWTPVTSSSSWTFSEQACMEFQDLLSHTIQTFTKGRLEIRPLETLAMEHQSISAKYAFTPH